jgi:hypothetical protein
MNATLETPGRTCCDGRHKNAALTVPQTGEEDVRRDTSNEGLAEGDTRSRVPLALRTIADYRILNTTFRDGQHIAEPAAFLMCASREGP